MNKFKEAVKSLTKKELEWIANGEGVDCDCGFGDKGYDPQVSETRYDPQVSETPCSQCCTCDDCVKERLLGLIEQKVKEPKPVSINQTYKMMCENVKAAFDYLNGGEAKAGATLEELALCFEYLDERLKKGEELPNAWKR